MAEDLKTTAPAVEDQLEPPIEEGQDNFAVLEEAARSYLPPEDVERVREAYRFALGHHRGQKRKSGEPYINHPVEVAIILAQNLRSDVDTLCAGLLHDTVEDTDATFEQIEQLFGKQVAELVDGVTKLTNISVSSLSEQQADRLRNMRTLMAIPEDRRIFKAHETMEIYAPLANRLGISSIKWELEDLSFFYLEPAKYRQIMRMVAESRDERERYLEEVIGVMRAELDRAGIKNYRIMGRPKHLYSIYMKMKNKGKDFSDIYDLIALRVITEDVRDCYGVLGAVHSLWTPMPGRFKDYIAMPKFNMYQSLHTTVIGPAGRPLEIQIRTEEMHQHAEYGIAAHWLYKQAGNSEGNKASDAQRLDNQLAWLGRTLDWTQQDDLSDPQEFLEALKIDLFESEVFVFTPKGEVQILRAGSTPLDFAYAVHTEVGNHCIGAKVNGSVVPLSYELQMGDRVEVLTQNNAKPSRDWLNIVRTPSARAKIRSYFSKMVPLSYELQMGDRVEVLTQNNAKPSRDWLNIVRTPSARAKIRSYFSKIAKADDSVQGREILARELRKIGLGISTPRTVRALAKVAPDLGFASTEDLFAAISNGKSSPRMIAGKVKTLLDGATDTQAEAEKRALQSLTTNATMTPPRISRSAQNAAERRKRSIATNGVRIEGGDSSMLVRLAHCCNPVMGDDIVGFITRGRGVSVHRADCPNVAELRKSEGRMIGVEWDTGQSQTFQVEIVVEAVDRTRLLVHRADCPNVAELRKSEGRMIGVEWDTGQSQTFQVEIVVEAVDRTRLLVDITAAISDAGANILSCGTRTDRSGITSMRFLIELSEISRLDALLHMIHRVDGVLDARRALPNETSEKRRHGR